MHWDGCATFRVACRGQFSRCLVLVGQALLPVRFDLAAAQVDRQECLSYQECWSQCDAICLAVAISHGAERGGGKMNLKNAVALITGGSSGIGRAIAQAFSASGARVAITGRDERRLAETARELGVHPIRADVAVEADVERTYREVLQKYGDLDILVNNAGIGVFKSLVDFDRENFEAVFATNVTGAMLMAREAAKHFVKRQRGNIVNIASTAALRGAPNGTAYYASKFALRGMTECWRAELRKYNIRVFLVNPSEVLTNFYPIAGLPQKVNATKLHAEDIAHIVKAMLEMEDRGFTPELSVFATNPKD
jgi:3-oxoacyl-[acyl-carrier protein] reductase